MSNVTIVSQTPGKLAGAINKSLSEGLSKSIPHFTATPCGSSLSVVLTEEPGKNRNASGSVHEVAVISGTQQHVQEKLSEMDTAHHRVIGFASHAVAAQAKKKANAEGEAKKVAKPAKAATVRFHALVATLQP